MSQPIDPLAPTDTFARRHTGDNAADTAAMLAELGQAFSEHVMDATDGWTHYATPEEMQGVPEDEE